MLRNPVVVLVVLSAALVGGCPPAGPVYIDGDEYVRVSTTLGDIVLDLAEAEAPRTTENFKQYVREGFYNGTVFHRVVPGFLIQGGGFVPQLQRKTAGDPAPAVTAALANQRGTVALVPQTDESGRVSTSIALNAVDNPELDAAGYVVFAQIVSGLDVLAALAALPTRAAGELAAAPAIDIELQAVSREATAAGEPARVRLATIRGTIVIEMLPAAPVAMVDHFLSYVDADFYPATLVHRVVAGRWIEAGAYQRALVEQPTRDPIVTESGNDIPNLRGTIGMARTAEVDSATAQFYINLNDNLALDATFDEPGYTVFGVVIEGLEVIDQIALVERTSQGALTDVPVEDIVIQQAIIEICPERLSPEFEQWLAGASYNLRNGARTILLDMLNRVLF